MDNIKEIKEKIIDIQPKRENKMLSPLDFDFTREEKEEENFKETTLIINKDGTIIKGEVVYPDFLIN